MERPQLELTMTSFIMSHFSYCPLVWMFHDRKLNKKINKIHERALRIIHRDSMSFTAEIFATKDVPYALGGGNNIVLLRARTNPHGIDTIRFIGQ